MVYLVRVVALGMRGLQVDMVPNLARRGQATAFAGQRHPRMREDYGRKEM